MKKKFTILYAEDKIDIRKNFSYFLQSKYPYASIYEASNGVEALDLFHKHQPDILITDINMPEMDGLSLIEKVRSHSQHVKIILLTAYSDQEKLLHAISFNVVNYLVKPINRTKLCDAIEIALETLPVQKEESSNFLYFDKDTKCNTDTHELFYQNEHVELSKYETLLLKLLCQNKNIQISALDIFTHVWEGYDKEFNASSIRSLIKNLRKKLPDETIENIYGGLYVLKIK